MQLLYVHVNMHNMYLLVVVYQTDLSQITHFKSPREKRCTSTTLNI